MNKYIQEYLKQREEKEKKSLMREVNRVVQNIEIGEKVYYVDSKQPKYEYPKFDTEKKMSYKYDIGDASIEELRLLLQAAAPKKEEIKPLEIAERSKWHTFATVMNILGGIAVGITLIVVLDNRDWTPFIIALGSYLVELGFWAVVQLLSGIKQGVDTLLLNKRK